eukprot:TRINITY_DN29235_c0_g1_i1.p3 TRINITY_DN29235_c0_g1~~TRINITY_DN29235_c0_g1_i1.p3  ORF type:complete len:180 (+),score=25.42 TRINITY_DN29235_c0_g1_i1:44-583(+)
MQQFEKCRIIMSINLGNSGTSNVQGTHSFEDNIQLSYRENSSLLNSANEADLESFLSIFQEEEKDLEAFLEEITTPLDLKLPPQVDTEICQNKSVDQKFTDLDCPESVPYERNVSNNYLQSRFCPQMCQFQNQDYCNFYGRKFYEVRQQSQIAEQQILEQTYPQQKKFNQFQFENLVSL